jgi:ubiquinone/menaquinone biosynthesis C-methylase UbiE
MNKEQLKINNQKYRNLQTKSNPSGRAGYDDITRQYLRFSEIKHFIGNLSGSVLDVGCGNAEFFKFLKMTGFEGHYTGIDVNKELLAEAKERFPDGKFLNMGILEMRNRKYDYVIASGIFNYDYGQDIVLIKKMLKKMYSVASRKVIFNGVCSQGTRRDKGTFYIDQWELCKWMEGEVGCLVEIRNCFVKFNFTLSMSRCIS